MNKQVLIRILYDILYSDVEYSVSKSEAIIEAISIISGISITKALDDDYPPSEE